MGTQSNSFDIAFTEVKKLVDKFKQGEKHYLSPSYNETEIRKDFIDKFFIALGWDVNHDVQQDPYQQEVKVEKTQDNQKRTDYTFYLSPNFKDTKFYVEAKKPSQNLRNADYYFQTIRYGWNSKTPIAVLTDFEEFHILDCRIRPDINKVLDGFHKQFYYTDYLEKEKFSEIYYLFSHESVSAGSLERYADSLPKPKGKATEKGFAKSKLQTIDEEFLEYIDSTRESLAKAFKKNDENLGSEELTEATQRTIDRLVFIRFLEDKLIEQDNYVSEFGKSNKAWIDFITVCRRLDSKYNGIVFKKHFIDEQNFRGPELNEFKNICSEISHLNSPYDFNAIPIHILGSIYERFLGKVVHATDKRVKVEEKPEVRKAGGVYYTPKYIVDYIVDNTIGKILRNETESSPLPPSKGGKEGKTSIQETESSNFPLRRGTKGDDKGKTPAEISKLRFADIACGSGSFLIGVFETLLDYHNKYYQQHKAQAKKDGCIEKEGIMVLSIKQKQNILLNNIYGVDIDQQAVEVTQLSLALKMLEDETTATANDMQVLFHEKILPDLSNNIICGNSLIGTDILSGSMFASEEERKLNPMDFETTFPQIFFPPSKGGRGDEGFDAIVGNPPYVRQEGLSDMKKYFIEHFESFAGTADLYTYFIEKGIKLLNDNGYFGYIVANKWMRANYGKNLREFLLKYNLRQIIDFGDLPVFKNATTYPCILIVNKTNKEINENIDYANVRSLEFSSLSDYVDSNLQTISKQFLNNDIWNLVSDTESSLIEKLNNTGIPLGEYVEKKVYYGIKTGFNEAFIIDQNIKNDLISQNPNSSELIKSLLIGKDIKRYGSLETNRYIIFTKQGVNINLYPAIKNHLIKFKDKLIPKPKNWKGTEWNGRKPGSYKWYELQDSIDYYQEFEKSKIIFPDIALQMQATFDNKNNYCVNTAYIIPIQDLYLLAIMNSKLVQFYYSALSSSIRGGYFRFIRQYIEQIPIIKINFQSENEKQTHDKIVKLVTQMLESKKQLQLIKTDKDKTYYERKCDTLDKQIDSEVYKLYGLTEEEIKIVEGKDSGN